MSESFIKKEIKIYASASRVWNVLVKQNYIEQWMKEFSSGNFITEDWQLQSEIAMTDDVGNVIQKGIITIFEPYKLLKIDFEETEYSETLRISDEDKFTLLSARAGPFKETEFKEHSAVWEKGLQKIKGLSESQ